MDFDTFRKQNLKRWNEIVISCFWLVLFFYVIGQVTVLILSVQLDRAEFELQNYLIYHMLIPDLLVLILTISAQLLVRVKPVGSELGILILGTLVSYTIFSFMSGDIHGGQVILALPIITSILYFNKAHLLYSAIVNISYFIIKYIFFTPANGNVTPYEFVVSLLMLSGIALIGFGVIARGIEMWKLLEDSKKTEQDLMVRSIILDKLTKTDALTGLYNHKTFHEYMENLIEQSDSYPLPLQLCILDIDNFKKVNDTYGHKVGDTVLKHVAKVLEEGTTQDDVVSRYGGEEFAIIFTGKTLEQSRILLEEIRQTLEQLTYEELEGRSITVSGGLSDRDATESKDQWFVRTDDLLYEAKRSGKNRIVTEHFISEKTS
ncbi:GGDEF domain-containing protein [Marinicrinis sediminis]|uniref:Diguanylate cyclase n=1 Tax=Marinicrinis sediminis TaxID=1652465 RepID=A0ABW5R6W7_9BACL